MSDGEPDIPTHAHWLVREAMATKYVERLRLRHRLLVDRIARLRQRLDGSSGIFALALDEDTELQDLREMHDAENLEQIAHVESQVQFVQGHLAAAEAELCEIQQRVASMRLAP